MSRLKRMWVEGFAVSEKFRVDLGGGEMVGMIVMGSVFAGNFQRHVAYSLGVYLMRRIKVATPGFKYSNPTQTAANAVGTAVSSSGDLEPLVNDKLK